MSPLKRLRELGLRHLASEVAVEELESVIGGTIPASLRDVIAAGGGRFGSEVTYRDGSDRVLVGWLMTARECLEAWQDLQGSIEESLLPFENDGGDNMLCIAVSGPYRGRIFFHDHGRATLDAGNVGDLPTSSEEIAQSFEQFVESLEGG